MSDLRAALQEALGPVYRVTREVRPVGNCRLFVALEEPTGSDLLAKVLPGELSLPVEIGRLERERVLLADRLTHPRLVPPKGSGRAGSHVYHTRVFVPGTTLRVWLGKNGALPLHVAVETVRDVVAALAHAHGAGVAHGDLRPENVLLSGKEATVADAGVVDAIERAQRGAPPGMVSRAICSPEYFSPERRDGAMPSGPDDIYALGVLIHEMLTGHPPEPDAERLDEVRSIQPWLSDLVRRCLAPDPAARWPDARAALDALE
jgi:serine/threonine-protein kinase